MIGQNKLAEAIEFASKIQNQFIDFAEYLFWRGKLYFLNGNTELGKKFMREALNKDPDNVSFQKGWRNIQKMEKLKQEAVELFQKGEFQEAIAKFTECIELDPLNASYNSTILFNRASAFARLLKNAEAIADLSKAIDLNEDYMKAYLKRGELNMMLKNFEEAGRDFERVRQLDPSVGGIREKIQTAKLEAKKAKRKDYYKIIGVEQNATDEEIKKAYKKQALKWHPDKHQNDDEEGKKYADGMFKDIGEAYEILQDS